MSAVIRTYIAPQIHATGTRREREEKEKYRNGNGRRIRGEQDLGREAEKQRERGNGYFRSPDTRANDLSVCVSALQGICYKWLLNNREIGEETRFLSFSLSLSSFPERLLKS